MPFTCKKLKKLKSHPPNYFVPEERTNTRFSFLWHNPLYLTKVAIPTVFPQALNGGILQLNHIDKCPFSNIISWHILSV